MKMKYIILIVIICSSFGCGSKKQIIDSSPNSYYQLQVSPADGTKRVFVHIEIPSQVSGKELEQFILNFVEVPYIFNQQEGYVEVYIRDYPEASNEEEREAAALYQKITQKDIYSACLKLGAGYYFIPAIEKLESQELELVAPPKRE